MTEITAIGCHTGFVPIQLRGNIGKVFAVFFCAKASGDDARCQLTIGHGDLPRVSFQKGAINLFFYQLVNFLKCICELGRSLWTQSEVTAFLAAINRVYTAK
jgi:hypothetical protein